MIFEVMELDKIMQIVNIGRKVYVGVGDVEETEQEQ